MWPNYYLTYQYLIKKKSRSHIWDNRVIWNKQFNSCAFKSLATNIQLPCLAVFSFLQTLLHALHFVTCISDKSCHQHLVPISVIHLVVIDILLAIRWCSIAADRAAVFVNILVVHHETYIWTRPLIRIILIIISEIECTK